MIVDCLEQVGGLHVQKVNNTDYINIFNGRTIKLTGTPWWCSREQAVISRWALAMIFEVLRLQNWSILTALDLSITLSDKSTFIFVKSAMPVAPPPYLPENSSSFQFQNFGFHTPIFNNLPCAPPKPIHSMVISLTDTNHLRFIGHYSDQDLEAWMKPIRSFAMGLKMEEYVEDVSNLRSSYDRCYKVEFKGGIRQGPWATVPYGCPGNSRIGWHSCMMMVNLYVAVKETGWSVITSGDVSGKFIKKENSTDFPIDTDSWFCVKLS